ncbi:MAG TPA: hypothetical protein VF094_08345 [Gaiellaceae bacterium]
MTTATGTDTGELLHELRGLCTRLPVPQPTWHPYADQIAACRQDFEWALALATRHPATLELLALLIEGELDPGPDPEAPPRSAAAARRLRSLPRPNGQHPYLDDILPALDALQLLLIALGRTGVG